MKLFLAYLLVFIFLSLIEASPIFPKYAKTGCRDKCGNVRIPYPFGIGADCSINQWYIIDCSSSKPYLRELSHLEVLGIDLKNITVTVNMPKISNCQNPFKNSTQTMSLDLEETPFLFSKEHNKFVLEGCGFASLVNNTSVVTACSTTCLSVTVSNRNNCFENGCCQTTIPSYLKSYTINLGLERQREDGGCDAAFLVDESLYDQGRVTNPLNVMGNASFIPVSLTWTLTKSDIVTCCNKRAPVQRILGVLNSIRVDTWICIYNTYSFDWNPYLTDECITEQATPKYAIKRCKYNCGNNVTIAYPFGIGADCSINRWYIVDCISFKPHLRALNHLEVLGVSWQNRTVIVRTPRNITDCKNSVRNSSEIKGVDLGRSPFFLSKGYNKFVFKGCGAAAAMMDNGSVLAGCSTTCPSLTHSDSNNCNGIGCCQIAIPSYLKSYNINITRLEEEDGGCGSAFLVDIMSYENPSFSDPVSVKSNTSFIPISLTWTLTDSDEVSCCYGDTPYGIRIGEMFNGTPVVTWICFGYSSSDANPYVIDGCTSNTGQGTEECRMCTDSGGYCTWDVLYSLDNTIFSRNFICKFQKRTSWGIILGVSISIGVILLVGTSYVLYKVIKKTREKRLRKKFFKRNGGLLLKQQEEADPSLVGKTIHFTSRELQKATDNFNENRILGRGGQGTVYKGMLVDGRIVAVKKSKIIDENQLEQFINEVVVLSQISHRNVVKLLGCCLETDVPLLVSEFIPNGTLYDRLHNETDDFPISLDMRLQIATEVAGALAYLHSATSIPIYHRDVKTSNILLDDKYRAKISDFGTSRFVSMDQTHLTTLVKGTFGYLDPEYFQSSQFTEKSDVYSFGVVFVELLTGEKPISLTRFGENRNLATHFMLAMEEGRVMSIFDARVIKEGTRDELLIAANLAMRCLHFNGKHRPTMKEVAIELETIRRSHVPSMVHTTKSPVVYREEPTIPSMIKQTARSAEGEELSILSYGESSSTF